MHYMMKYGPYLYNCLLNNGNTAIPTYLPPISKLAPIGRLKASANINNALNSLKQKVMDVSTEML